MHALSARRGSECRSVRVSLAECDFVIRDSVRVCVCDEGMPGASDVVRRLCGLLGVSAGAGERSVRRRVCTCKRGALPRKICCQSSGGIS